MVLESCSSFFRLEISGNFEILRRPQCSDTTKNDSDNITIIADGAHTEESAVCLRKTLLEVFSNDEPIVFVLAMASDKNHSGILKALSETPSMVEMVATKVDVAGKDLIDRA